MPSFKIFIPVGEMTTFSLDNPPFAILKPPILPLVAFISPEKEPLVAFIVPVKLPCLAKIEPSV